MKNQEKIKFDYALYQIGLYDAYISYNNREEPFEILSIRNNFAIGWQGNLATNVSVENIYLVKRPRKIWVHIIESPDGILSSRVTDYQEVTTYKGNTIVKQIEVEI
jgi:hypothetical protein